MIEEEDRSRRRRTSYPLDLDARRNPDFRRDPDAMPTTKVLSRETLEQKFTQSMKLKIEENDDGEVQAILRWLNHESETAVSSLNSGPIRSENRFENGECEVAHRGGRIASISGSDLLRFAAVSSPMCFEMLLLFLGHSLSHSPDALSRLQDDPTKMFCFEPNRL